MPLDEARVVAVGHEANFLALRLLRDRQCQAACDCPHLVLGEVADREERPRELLLRQAEEEVRLVFRSVARAQQAVTVTVMRDTRVVPGGDDVDAERAGAAPELVELEVAVAEHAWVRRAAAQVL